MARVIRSALLVAKSCTAVMYVVSSVFGIFLFGVALIADHIAQFNLLSASVSLAALALLAILFVRNPGQPISANSVVTLGAMYSVAFLLNVPTVVAYLREGPIAIKFGRGEWLLAQGLSLAFIWLIVVMRLRQIKLIKSPDFSRTFPGFLLLRSFRFDQIRSSDSLNRFSSFVFAMLAKLRWVPVLGEVIFDLTYDLRYQWTYESLLRSGLEDRDISTMTVSLYNPQWRGIPPACGTFVKVGRRDDWRSVVAMLLRQSRLVVVLPGESAGLLEELNLIRHSGLAGDRVLLLVPESASDDLLTTFAGSLRDREFDLSGVTLAGGELYTFDSDWCARRIAPGIESHDDAVLEILAWSVYKDYPAPAWCELDRCSVRPTPAGRCPSCGLVIDLERNDAVSRPDQGPAFPRPALPLPDWEPILPATRWRPTMTLCALLGRWVRVSIRAR